MTSTIQSMGNDVKAPANETMTLDRMETIWHFMTPEQQELVAMMCATNSFYVVAGGNMLDSLKRAELTESAREAWNDFDWPFKLGALNGRRTTT